MGRLIKKFSCGSVLEFDIGKFDDWCIYFNHPVDERVALKDEDIFDRLDKLGQQIGSVKLYKDFLTVYEQTDSQLSQPILSLITELSRKYPELSNEFDYLITYLYAGMVAEENKAKAILRKRIKRLGVHQLLIEERPSSFATNFSRNKKWKEIVIECEVRGF